jgi:hypothetical protein
MTLSGGFKLAAWLVVTQPRSSAPAASDRTRTSYSQSLRLKMK